LGHQARYEGHVARQAVELGNNDRTLASPPRGERCRELRPPVEGICPLPRFDLDELDREVEGFGRRKPRDGIALGLDAEARSALAGGGDASPASIAEGRSGLADFLSVPY